MTIHLVVALPPAAMRTLAGTLRSERIAFVWSGPEAAAVAAAISAAAVLDVPHRVDPALAGLDVPGLATGAGPGPRCREALDGIADLHRGEHVLVIAAADGGAGAPAAAAERVDALRLEIGDDGWRLA